MKFTLSNFVFQVDEFLKDYESLLFKSDGPYDFDVQTGEFSWVGDLDLLTYFNALPLCKWRQYAGIDNVHVHVEVAGDIREASVEAMRGRKKSWRRTTEGTHVLKPTDEFVPVDFDISVDNATLVGLTLRALGPARLRNAYFWTEVDEQRVNEVRIALSTTTFNNEQYIIPNVEQVRKQIVESDDPISAGFHMFVVDNGQTLDAEELSGPGISVLPNRNVGGAGGFARGMIEAMESTAGFTHIILMDDDVKIFPESIKRTHALLSLAQGKYRNAFINGAMLELQEPDVWFEDVSFVRKTGGYEKYKPIYFVSDAEEIAECETVSVEGRNSYGAWWFCVMPLAAIREHGLPLPFFVRGDDLEYGIRCQSVYMTMSGIGIWHSQFKGRYRPSVDLYQYQRNIMIAIVMHPDISSQEAFMVRFWRIFHILLRVMNYDAAELWLDALEDYLRGPAWFAAVDGAALMKKNGQKNEKLVPLDELDRDIMQQLDLDLEWIGVPERTRSWISRSLESIPHDRHWMPESLLIKKPAVIDYTGNLGPWQNVAMRDTLVALDTSGTKGIVRKIDRQRYDALIARYNQLRADYEKRHGEVDAEYRDAFPYLTSVEFWKEYLAR